MAREGMSDLIGLIRYMVDDTGTTVWTDDHIQDVADRYRVEIYGFALVPQAKFVAGETVYLDYSAPYHYLEGAASGSEAWRVYDSGGTTIGTAEYTADYDQGWVHFAVDQAGSTRYLDARSYDPHAAAAALWLERAAMTADGYDFSADGAKFNRAQYFQHCRQMADLYRGLARSAAVPVLRSDMNGGQSD